MSQSDVADIQVQKEQMEQNKLKQSVYSEIGHDRQQIISFLDIIVVHTFKFIIILIIIKIELSNIDLLNCTKK